MAQSLGFEFIWEVGNRAFLLKQRLHAAVKTPHKVVFSIIAGKRSIRANSPSSAASKVAGIIRMVYEPRASRGYSAPEKAPSENGVRSLLGWGVEARYSIALGDVG